MRVGGFGYREGCWEEVHARVHDRAPKNKGNEYINFRADGKGSKIRKTPLDNLFRHCLGADSRERKKNLDSYEPVQKAITEKVGKCIPVWQLCYSTCSTWEGGHPSTN